MQKQVPAVQVARKIVDVPQTQFIDREMFIPVVQQRQVVQTVQKTLEIPQCSKVEADRKELDESKQMPAEAESTDPGRDTAS